MKQGSHIMLQRLVRSIVRTEPRPYFTVDDPWWCNFSSAWAAISRPGKTSSRCCENSGSIDITSSKCPCVGQSLTIRILPSRSMICALISPTFSVMSTSCGRWPSRICWRISGTHLGQSESVVRGHPNGGFDFSWVLSSGFSYHFGVGEGLGLIRFKRSNTTQAPLAATVTAFSTYLIGLRIVTFGSWLLAISSSLGIAKSCLPETHAQTVPDTESLTLFSLRLAQSCDAIALAPGASVEPETFPRRLKFRELTRF